MYYLYWKYSTRIEVLSKTFKKNLYVCPKESKGIWFWPKPPKNIIALPQTLEKYRTFSDNIWKVCNFGQKLEECDFDPKTFEQYLICIESMGKVIVFPLKPFEKYSILNENNQNRRARTSNRYGEKYIASNQNVLNESRIIVENFRIFLKK